MFCFLDIDFFVNFFGSYGEFLSFFVLFFLVLFFFSSEFFSVCWNVLYIFDLFVL